MPARPLSTRDLSLNLPVALRMLLVVVLVAELGVRAIDGYRLDSLRLSAIVDHSEQPAAATLAEARKATFAKGFDVAWYNATPPAYDHTTDFTPPPDWEKAARDYPRVTGKRGYVEFELKFLYNDKWVQEACATGSHTELLRQFKPYPGFVYGFVSPDGATKPEYRLVPRGWGVSGTYNNNFGFRGPDVIPQKPDRTIRLAFLGSSVTANGWPYTYPEYTVEFLRRWARANHIDVDFDVINAARGAIDSASIAGITEYEVIASTGAEEALVIAQKQAGKWTGSVHPL